MTPSMRVRRTLGAGGAEAGQGARDERGVGGGERADPQVPGGAGVHGGDLAAGQGEPVEDRRRVFEQAGALGGEGDAARQPVEQPRADLQLQGRDLAGHGRLRVAQRRRGAGDRALPGDLPEHLQHLRLHGDDILTRHGSDARHSLVACQGAEYGRGMEKIAVLGLGHMGAPIAPETGRARVSGHGVESHTAADRRGDRRAGRCGRRYATPTSSSRCSPTARR